MNRAIFVILFIFIFFFTSCGFVDIELRNQANELALQLDSKAFFGFDPSEKIKTYYFIPVTLDEAVGVALIKAYLSQFDMVQAYDTDSGVIKARNAGFRANYGIVVYRKDGKIIAAPASVDSKR